MYLIVPLEGNFSAQSARLARRTGRRFGGQQGQVSLVFAHAFAYNACDASDWHHFPHDV
jgi:hypothetical protein